jgi:hypothetical protein
LGVRDVRKNLALEQLGEDRCSLGSTGRAEPAALTGESDEKLKAALWTNDAGEAGFEESTIQIRENGGIPVAFPESVSSLESFFPQALEGFEMGIEELIEGAGARIAGPIGSQARGGPRQSPGGRGSAAHEEARRNPSPRTSRSSAGDFVATYGIGVGDGNREDPPAPRPRCETLEELEPPS